ncbi:ATP-grasp domain-containing protein [Acinetobacter johnsonii]|uniref:ATP-grasp domain-containing protein n=1 Tax=Acinetobacter johnsonii TaxID=40214 RepID=UPI0022E4583B|nr:ATP-grasp domain-containing protein [Acinetobacter johnsonii]
MNILVSGVASDIGLGVGRVLRSNSWNGKIYGIDIQSDHAGMFIYDSCAIAPRADEPYYLDWLEQYIIHNNIKIFIPTSEAEISKIVREGVNKISDAIIIKTSDLVIQKSLDKHECLRYLSSCGILVPEHGLLKDGKPKAYPVIVKPRSGQGSKRVCKVYSESELPVDLDGSLVWQKYLGPDTEEYTCPVFRSPETETRVLIIKRELQGGFTSKGEVIDNMEIKKYVESIAHALDLDGVMNVQLRLTEEGPRLFEINPRLSSTLVFRDKMGFRDLEWLLSQRIGMPIAKYIPPTTGTRFYRGVQEYISLA